MFKPHISEKYPVQIYRATDTGAPQLKFETGSLKTLLKTCLINGYGEGINRKEPIAAWKMSGETADTAIFYSEKTQNIGLKVENSNARYVKTHMVGGERFATYLGYVNQDHNHFSYGNDFACKNWLLLACETGFFLVLHEDNTKSQILFFGKINGLFEDDGNICCVNTSFMANNTYYDNGTFDHSSKTPLLVRSQWRDGGNAALAAVECVVLSPFSATNTKYPDSLYQNTTASAIVLAEKTGAPRGTMPALFWCYHNLQGVVNEMDLVDMADGQKYIKLNLEDGGASTHCFVLNIQEWEV